MQLQAIGDARIEIQATVSGQDDRPLGTLEASDGPSLRSRLFSGIALAALVALGTWWLTGRSNSDTRPPLRRTLVAIPELSRLGGAAISPEGDRIAFVGDNNNRAGFRHQHIGPGNADIGVDKALPQNLPRFIQQNPGFCQSTVGGIILMSFLKSISNLLYCEVNGRRDDVAWRFFPKLNDVFAKVRLNRDNARFFQAFVKRDFLADH